MRQEELVNSILNELEYRLLTAYNGKLPDFVKSEFHGVLQDMHIKLISSNVEISSTEQAQFGEVIQQHIHDGVIETGQILFMLHSSGWVIIPPR